MKPLYSKEDADRLLKKKFGNKISLLGEFVTIGKPAKLKCHVCGKIFSGSVRARLASTYSCLCLWDRKKKYSHDKFMELFSQRPKSRFIKILGRYTGSLYKNKIAVECKKCGYQWESNPNMLLFKSSSCPKCSRFRNPLFKSYDLGKRKVTIQGYEGFALDKLLEFGIKADTIQVFTEGTVPKIRYKFRGRFRNYHPDMKIGERQLVEVKSIWTLLNDLEATQAKARSCIAEGYKFALLLTSPVQTCRMPDKWLTWKRNSVLKWWREKSISEKPVTVFAIDPGSTNFGWSVIHSSKPDEFKVVATGLLENPIKDLTADLVSQADLFSEEVNELMDHFGVSAFACERFMYRRGLNGTTMETVGFMIGVCIGMAREHKRKMLLMPAAQWKNEFNRYTSLEELYPLASCTNHQVDSVLIGMYALYYWRGLKPFAGIAKIKKNILSQIDDATWN